ncbi:MAG: hypothetical protein ABL859_01310 [Methylotenera sp.]
MKNMRLTVILISIMATLAACGKGAPDIKNIDELEKISKGGAGRFVIKTEDKEYTPASYFANFCSNSPDDKNCIAVNVLSADLRAAPSKSVLGNN